MPDKLTCHIDVWKLCPCALISKFSETAEPRVVYGSRKRYDFDIASRETNIGRIMVPHWECLRRCIVLETGMQDLSHILLGHSSINFKFFHVTRMCCREFRTGHLCQQRERHTFVKLWTCGCLIKFKTEECLENIPFQTSQILSSKVEHPTVIKCCSHTQLTILRDFKRRSIHCFSCSKGCMPLHLLALSEGLSTRMLSATYLPLFSVLAAM